MIMKGSKTNKPMLDSSVLENAEEVLLKRNRDN